ncbi:MAG: hypothetical protein U5K37_01685 [Natrialbaceae archaeon]|nr:hypothetical protein [Natrialbaceae archaeon]
MTDRDGTRYEVLATGETAWQLRAVVSGRETTLDPALLSPASLAPLEERGLGVDPASADALGVSDLLGLGVLERLADSGPTPVETLLTAAGACERELSGRLADLQVAGLMPAGRPARWPRIRPD